MKVLPIMGGSVRGDCPSAVAYNDLSVTWAREPKGRVTPCLLPLYRETIPPDTLIASMVHRVYGTVLQCIVTFHLNEFVFFAPLSGDHPPTH